MRKFEIRKSENSEIREFGNSEIRKFENAKVRKFVKIRKLENSKIRTFENSKIRRFENSKSGKFENPENSNTVFPGFLEALEGCTRRYFHADSESDDETARLRNSGRAFLFFGLQNSPARAKW